MNKPTLLQSPKVELPDLITAVTRNRFGYWVYSDGWQFYPVSQLEPEQVEELEDWREELRPGK